MNLAPAKLKRGFHVFSLVFWMFLPSLADAVENKAWPAPGQPGQALAVQVDNRPLLFLGQLLPWDSAGQVRGDARAQAKQVLANLRTALTSAGAKIPDIVRVNAYVVSDDISLYFDEVLAEMFASHPVTVSYVRSATVIPGAMLAIDAIAALPPAGKKVTLLTIPGFPAPSVGSHGAVLPAGSKIFISGQAEEGKDLRLGSRNTLASLDRSLEFLKAAKSDVVQVKAFFKPFESRSDLEEEVRAFFSGGPIPPLVLVEWRSARPAEIEFVVAGAEKGAAGNDPLRFTSLPGLASTPRYSRAVIVEGGVPLIFLAGLYGGADSGAREETKEVFTRLGTLLFEVGSGFRYLVKGTYYTNASDASRIFGDIRDVYYDPTRPPASSGVSVPGVGRPGSSMTLDLIVTPRPKSP